MIGETTSGRGPAQAASPSSVPTPPEERKDAGLGAGSEPLPVEPGIGNADPEDVDKGVAGRDRLTGNEDQSMDPGVSDSSDK